MFSDSFAGIAPASVPGFIVAELIGAGIGVAVHKALGSNAGQVALPSTQQEPSIAASGTDPAPHSSP
jgi:hypothetical protein